MINALISAVSPKSIQDFFRQQNRSFVPYSLVETRHATSLQTEITKLGEIEYADTDKLLIFSCLYDGELSARSARKMQFDIAKKALKDDFKDGAIFVFYDAAGRFRFSFIRRNYGNKDQKYSPWKRYTYFVDPAAQTNRTFMERVGTCKFESLDAIQQAFSVEQLTKDFYKELSNWYFWAIKVATFPNNVNDDSDDKKFNSENIIRLITRLIFVWFLRQKDLIKPPLFDVNALGKILRDFEPESQTQHNYYRAILQNLFFATLNQEIDKRGFAEDKNYLQNKTTYNIKNLYRYENEFQHHTDQIMELFNQVPFLNGGLFECLDNKKKDENTYDWDGFSRNPHLQAKLPNVLFFGSEAKVDLSGEYNDKKMKAVRVTGIIEILKRYNFTVEENTPVEVEVALDPELLGKVFENLLGAFNPETQETARKQTGSFYTPREIVNYMVDESLIAYFKTKVPEVPEVTLRNLLGYDETEIELTDIQCTLLIQAIFNCKMLDPATGSGAFPMGFLQQMVHILRKLDPENTHWEKVVMAQAMTDFEATDDLNAEERQNLRAEIEHSFDDSVNHPDYARKLYLIENCIYGVDIQSIAVQISKLRFFISLICEQNHSTDATDNFGIRPLPNLEIKFVAANTLIGIEKNEEDMALFKQDKIRKLIDKLKQVRHRQFLVTNAQQKKKLRDDDETLRHDIVTEVQKLYVKRADDDIFRLKMQLKQTEKELEILNKKPDNVQTSAEQLDIFGGKKTKTINVTENKRAELKTLINRLNTQITEGSKYTKLESVVQLAQQLTSWNPYDQNASSPFFDPEWMFGVIDGFDIVCGNPPYIDSESMTNLGIEKERMYIVDKYDFISGNWDIYMAFFEKGLKLSKGILCYITPDKWLSKPFGLKFRKECLMPRLAKILHAGNGVFESATVDAIISIFVKSSDFITVQKYDVNKDVKSINYYQKAKILEPYLIDFLFSENSKLVKRVDDNVMKIDDLAKCENACATSDAYKLSELIEDIECPNNDDYYRLINTGTISKYYNRWGLKEITYLGSKVFFPVIKKTDFHLNLGQSYTRRSKAKKIIFKGLNLLDACLDLEGNIIPGKTTLVICNNDDDVLKFLCGIINSSISINYIKIKYSSSSYCGGISFTKDMINSLPLPDSYSLTKYKIIDIVDEIIETKKHNKLEPINHLEQQIDNLVYRLYDLTYDEVKVIDPDIESKISEEDYNLIEIE